MEFRGEPRRRCPRGGRGHAVRRQQAFRPAPRRTAGRPTPSAPRARHRSTRVIVVCPPGLDCGDWPGDPPVEAVRIASTELSASLKAGIAAAAGLRRRVRLPRRHAAGARWRGRRLAAALGANFAAVPRHGGSNGHPVLLSARAFPALADLRGDEGAGRLLKARSDVAFLDVATKVCSSMWTGRKTWPGWRSTGELEDDWHAVVQTAASAAALLGLARAASRRKRRRPRPAPMPTAANPAADPMFGEPYIDIDEWRDAPVRHRYVHGGFKGTDTRFSLYLPPKEQYRGRFFQYITPVPDSENLAQGRVRAGGRQDRLFRRQRRLFTSRPTAAAARSPGSPAPVPTRPSAAIAPMPRPRAIRAIVAQQMYGPHRTYGYAYGGSGGAFRTLGAVENTARRVGRVGALRASARRWRSPTCSRVRMHAMRLLKGKFDRIVDALEPGGSGDIYAGLDRGAGGGPARSHAHGLSSRAPGSATAPWACTPLPCSIRAWSLADPGYFADFWTKPGYLGLDLPESFAGYRLQFRTTIAPRSIADEAEARGPRRHAHSRHRARRGRHRLAGAGARRHEAPGRLPARRHAARCRLPRRRPFRAVGRGRGQAHRPARDQGRCRDPRLSPMLRVLAQLKPGDEVQIDNSNFLAAQTYHRHQVPGPEYKVWDQFRGADGKPLYPQRPMLLGPLFTANASGAVPKGVFDGKMILVESLWDREALPWQADWYRARCAASRARSRRQFPPVVHRPRAARLRPQAGGRDPHGQLPARCCSRRCATSRPGSNAACRRPHRPATGSTTDRSRFRRRRARGAACSRWWRSRPTAARGPMSRRAQTVSFTGDDRGAARHRTGDCAPNGISGATGFAAPADQRIAKSGSGKSGW